MKFIADFHIHSKHSRATSQEMTVEKIAQSCRVKGVRLVGTGDFTHPKWLEELEHKLKPNGEGLFEYDDTYFMLVTEVNNTYTQNGRLRRIHNMIFAPDFQSVHRKLPPEFGIVIVFLGIALFFEILGWFFVGQSFLANKQRLVIMILQMAIIGIIAVGLYNQSILIHVIEYAVPSL